MLHASAKQIVLHDEMQRTCAAIGKETLDRHVTFVSVTNLVETNV